MQELPYFFPISQHSTLNYRALPDLQRSDLPSTGEATSRTPRQKTTYSEKAMTFLDYVPKK